MVPLVMTNADEDVSHLRSSLIKFSILFLYKIKLVPLFNVLEVEKSVDFDNDFMRLGHNINLSNV